MDRERAIYMIYVSSQAYTEKYSTTYKKKYTETVEIVFYLKNKLKGCVYHIIS